MTISTITLGKDWIQTYTGRRICPIDPDPSAIDITDIAHALAVNSRFTGHTYEPYSVAQHSVLVSRYCHAKDALWGLLHDASEAYLSDIARPVKQHMPEYKAIEEKLMEAIAIHFNLQMPIPASVKEADNALLMAERRDLLVPLEGWTQYGIPIDEHIVPWQFTAAERVFLERFEELNG
jgi:uncharacterized protein